MSRAAVPSGPAICFVAAGAYGALSGRPDLRHIGGAEIQQVRVGRELARRGYNVSFVTLDHGQPDGVVHEGMTVVKTCRWADGLPGLRFIHPRWTSLWRALDRADADLYYQRGAGSETGQIALWCRRRGRPFVFATASDNNCLKHSPDLPSRREQLLYRYGLQRASRVLCQTGTQAEVLTRNFGRAVTVIRNCAEDPLGGSAGLRRVPGPSEGRLLWVGRLHREKNFELVLDIARARPALAVDVVGGSAGDSDYSAELMTRARKLENVTMHGWVPHETIGAFYDRASALLCTSPVEGFPNTFLEAWARGIPTVSTVDPDGVIASGELGAVGRSLAELVEGIDRLHTSSERWLACSQRARRHFLQHHTIRPVVDRYDDLFRELLSETRRSVA